MEITRAISALPSGNQTWAARWEGKDGVLTVCWDRRREKAGEVPELAALASAGVLVALSWKGGIGRATKFGHKFGSFYYLAMWQGLRGDPLDVSLDEEVTIACTKTGMTVTCTPHVAKYAEA